VAIGEPEGVRDELLDLSFLGVEIKRDEFEFYDDPRRKAITETLAQKLADSNGVRRYQVHPAFRPYLEISDEYQRELEES
jgi:hypothetical protein